MIVRSGFEEMKASPWEKEDAIHEDIPILEVHDAGGIQACSGKLIGVTFQKVKVEYDAKGRRNLVPSGEPDQTIPADDVLVAVGQRTPFPGSTGLRHRVGKWRRCPKSIHDLCLDQSKCFSAATRPSAPEHHLGGGARPDAALSIHSDGAISEDITSAHFPKCMCPRRRWASTSGAMTTTSRRISASRCPHRQGRC